MSFLNVEIKAKTTDPSFAKNYLLQHGAEFKGTDHQTDTYFNVSKGRLKLREGNIENNLIYYERKNIAGPKSSQFHLIKVDEPENLKLVLQKSLGIKLIVKKEREIYYICNVKFHIDKVPELGTFIEIEAGNVLADKTKEELQDQCNFYMKELRINEEDLVDVSYSDLL